MFCCIRAGLPRVGRLVLHSLLAIAVLLAVGCTEPLGPEGIAMIEIPGYSYTSFQHNGFWQGKERGALALLKQQTGAQWVSLCVFVFQSTPYTSDIAPNTTGVNPLTGKSWQTSSTWDDLQTAVADARAQGLRIMLKPHVDCYSGEWRAAIVPDETGTWFAAYTTILLQYAQFAEQHHIDMLCIGVEYAIATQPQYNTYWQALIRSVRSVYSGKLTYAANWSPAFTMKQAELEHIPFWRQLDYIGVDFYGALAKRENAPSPNYGNAYARMVGRASHIEKVAQRVGRSVILTEVGIQSVQGALASPYQYTRGNASSAQVDNTVQELYYRAVLDVFGNKPWCAGFFWWNWESTPTATRATNYTAEGKPAAALLKTYYQQAQSTPL